MNFLLIRDLFRQHVNNRRELDDSCILMREEDIMNIKNLKELITKIISQFNKLMGKNPANKDPEKFEKFIRHTAFQQEILSSELWKTDKFIEYVNEIALKITQEQEKMCSSMRLDFSN